MRALFFCKNFTTGDGQILEVEILKNPNRLPKNRVLPTDLGRGRPNNKVFSEATMTTHPIKMLVCESRSCIFAAIPEQQKYLKVGARSHGSTRAYFELDRHLELRLKDGPSKNKFDEELFGRPIPNDIFWGVHWGGRARAPNITLCALKKSQFAPRARPEEILPRTKRRPEDI